jgi:hypothetical protein
MNLNYTVKKKCDRGEKSEASHDRKQKNTSVEMINYQMRSGPLFRCGAERNPLLMGVA